MRSGRSERKTRRRRRTSVEPMTRSTEVQDPKVLRRNHSSCPRLNLNASNRSLSSLDSVPPRITKIKFAEDVSYIDYPAKFDIVECPSMYWYSNKDLFRLMDHEIEIATQDRECLNSNYTCSRGIEHLLSGKNKFSKISKHCQGVLQIQALVRLSGKKANASKVIKSFSQKQSDNDRKIALKYGKRDALDAKRLHRSPLSERQSRPRIIYHETGRTCKMTTGDYCR